VITIFGDLALLAKCVDFLEKAMLSYFNAAFGCKIVKILSKKYFQNYNIAQKTEISYPGVLVGNLRLGYEAARFTI
jgi:hypothetical protein